MRLARTAPGETHLDVAGQSIAVVGDANTGTWTTYGTIFRHLRYAPYTHIPSDQRTYPAGQDAASIDDYTNL